MPNYLSVDFGGVEGSQGQPGPPNQNSGTVSGGLGSGFSASGSVDGVSFAFGNTFGAGGGSKPMALHTEHAQGEANWDKPYGSGTDIEFYLMRADLDE